MFILDCLLAGCLGCLCPSACPRKGRETPAALMVTIEDRRAHLSIHLMNGELSVEGKHSSQLIKLIVAASLIRNSIEYPSLLCTL